MKKRCVASKRGVEDVAPYNDVGVTIEHIKASLNRKRFPKEKTCKILLAKFYRLSPWRFSLRAFLCTDKEMRKNQESEYNMKSSERFLKYIKYSTASSETSGVTPSTDGQLVLAKALNDELLSMGIKSTYNDLGYVYAVIPATEGCENVPAIGFIAHMDTSPEFSGEGVKAQLIENYDGKDVVLGESGRTLKVSDFPHLKGLKGKTLITTDGTTLLGGDDKAGIAEIMTLAEMLLTKNIPHGKICIGFTPDEEIGEGADHFDVPLFGADFGYTVDVGGVG